MILSMTGFGLAEAEEQGLSVRVEVRSVNHRFLQLRHRLPADFADLEPKLDALCRKKLARGSATVTVNLVRAGAPGAVAVDLEVARRYRELLSRAATELAIPDDLSVASLVQLPGVVGVRPDEKLHEREARVILRAAGAALDALLEMRAVEGKALEQDLAKNGKAIRRLVARISKRMPVVVRGHMEALQKRVGELLGSAGAVPPGELARELAVIADRMDVGEELQRLASHMDQLDALLAKGGSVGRQLDFLVQELHREANTIGSKCNDAEVAHAVVELKTHIERVREQVQNAE